MSHVLQRSLTCIATFCRVYENRKFLTEYDFPAVTFATVFRLLPRGMVLFFYVIVYFYYLADIFFVRSPYVVLLHHCIPQCRVNFCMPQKDLYKLYRHSLVQRAGCKSSSEPVRMRT